MAERETQMVDIASLDALYSPFAEFSKWARVKVDVERWADTLNELQAIRSELEKEALESGIDFTLRAAAIDTGAIEGLYDVDRGFTISVAMDAVGWQAEAKKRAEDIERFFEAQMIAYNLVLDAVTKAMPVSEAWLRALHEELCEPQDTYVVQTPQGLQEHALPKGEYKQRPNHVVTEAGKKFAYAPVAMTAPEMQRFLEELRTAEFEGAHPVVQAAYAHYSLVRIHPFADGNGRVARALASLYSLRSASVPLIIFADQRNEYFDALEGADAGDSQLFLNFISDRIIDGMLIQIDRLKALQSPALDRSAQALDQLYKAYHGLRHLELDDAAYRFAEAILAEFEKQLAELRLPSEVTHSVNLRTLPYGESQERQGFRSPLKKQGRSITLNFGAQAPAEAQIGVAFLIYISKHESEEAELLIAGLHEYATFGTSVEEVYPNRSQAFDIRLAFWVEGIFRAMLDALQEQAKKSLQDSGYS